MNFIGKNYTSVEYAKIYYYSILYVNDILIAFSMKTIFERVTIYKKNSMIFLINMCIVYTLYVLCIYV